jgi:hypothetical protein
VGAAKGGKNAVTAHSEFHSVEFRALMASMLMELVYHTWVDIST